MNKAFVYIALFILLLPSAFALDTLYEDWLYSGQTITADSRTYIIYRSTTTEAFADYGTGILSLKNNSCNQVENLRLCLDNIEYSIDAAEYRLKIRAISLAPDITITRTIENEEFEAGEGTEITVSIANSGGLAQDVSYTDSYPDYITIESVDGAFISDDHTVTWRKSSMNEETEAFSYKILVNDVIDRSFAGRLDYFDGRNDKTIRSDVLDIKTSPRLKHELLLGFANRFVGERNNLTINLTNKESSAANVTVDFFLDEGLKVTKKPREFTKISETHYHSNFLISKPAYNITVNRSAAYYFEFEGTKVGTFGVRAQVKYSAKGVSDRVLPELRDEVIVTDKGVKVRTNLDDVEIEANQARTLKVWLQNLNPDISIKNIVIKMDGGGLLDLPDLTLGKLNPFEHEKVIETDFFAPKVNSSKGYTLRVNVSYFTEFGENFSDTFTFTETVSEIGELTITKTLTKQTLESGEETTVNVKVKNPRKTKISGIVVAESIPKEFTVFGKTSGIIDLRADDEQTAYTYVLKAHRVNRETVYMINTTASYSDSNAAQIFNDPNEYTVKKESSLTVKPQKFVLTVTRTIDDEDIFMGDFFDVIYKIVNPTADTTAENIIITLPLEEEFDLVDTPRQLKVATLGPGEEITLFDGVERRTKKVGSYTLGQAPVDYLNQYGESFHVNVSPATMKTSDRANSDTYVFITKNASAKANNTDFFEVTLTTTNTGRGLVNVLVEDGDFSRDFAMQNGSRTVMSYRTRIEKPGTYTLPPASATYAFKGKKMVTGSNTPAIEIVDNPALRLEKSVPAETLGSRIQVELKISVLAGGVSNITVTDGDEKYHFGTLQAATKAYTQKVEGTGAYALPAAAATYTFNGILYTVNSNTPATNVLEKKLLVLNKSLAVSEAALGEEVEVILTATNDANDELTALITEGSEEWKVTLAPGETKEKRFKAKAGNISEASAAFKYMDEEYTVLSDIPELLIDENGKVNKDGEGIISRILGFITSIFSW